ncbi:uncharacterized protein K441DRAFT_593952, partial [Cenococcum geophilum 1.58]
EKSTFIYEQVIAIRKHLLSNKDLDTLKSKSDLATKAIKIVKKMLEVRRRVLKGDYLDTLTSIYNLLIKFLN